MAPLKLPPRRRCEMELARAGRSPNVEAARGELAAVFGESHVELLQLVAKEKTVPRDLCGPLLSRSEDEIHSVLADLVSAGALCMRPFLWDAEREQPEPAWYWMDLFGLKLVSFKPSHPFRPTEIGRKHTRGVLKTRLKCQQEWPEKLWLPEADIIERFGRTSGSRRSRSHTADAALENSDGTLTGVEYERTGKRPEVVVENMEKLLERFTDGYYFCTDEVREKVEKLKESHGFDDITVFPEPEFPGIA
jgi:hypothetical protein